MAKQLVREYQQLSDKAERLGFTRYAEMCKRQVQLLERNSPIVPVYEVDGEHYEMSDYVIYTSFVYQGHKVRTGFSVSEKRGEGNLFRLTLRIDKKRKAPRFISTTRLLYCIGRFCVQQDGKFYVSVDVIHEFCMEFAIAYMVRKFNLPYQLGLPLWTDFITEEPEQQGDISHPALTVIGQ